MHQSGRYGCLVAALFFSNFALAESAKIDGLVIEYAKRNLAPEQLDSHSAAQLTLSNNYEQLIDIKTTLQPGCANLPTISTLQVNGHALPVICGNNGAGRNETLQVIGQLGSNRSIAALNFGQMAAEIRSFQDKNYFLTAQTDADQTMHFKVYRLSMDDSMFGFIPAEDEQSSNIYQSVLMNYQAAEVNTEQRVVETLRLIEQSRMLPKQKCEALKLLSDKTPAGISQVLTIKLSALHEQACKGN